MEKIENTVFISYRRTNAMHARAVYQALKSQGYDCFLDFQNIDAGAFEQIIISQIKARAHFVLILTPSALERCNEPGDWLRREIETAMDYKRNIVPLMMDGFDYRSPVIRQALTGKLEILSSFNALTVHTDYFDEAMSRLVNRFLNKPVDAILYPMLPEHEEFVNENITAADNVTKVTPDELRAAEWFESGFAKSDKGDFSGAVDDYNKSIELNPKQHLAFYQRALAKSRLGNKPAALMDFTQAILIQADYVNAYVQRGLLRGELGDIDGEIEDYTTALRYEPQAHLAYNYRAAAYNAKKLYDKAIADANQALLIKPDLADAFYQRATAQLHKGNLDLALADYSATITNNPNHDKAYFNRAIIYTEHGDLQKAFDDYTALIRLHDRSGGNEQISAPLIDGLFIGAYRNRATIYEAWGNLEGAISDLEKYMSYTTHDADLVLGHIAYLQNQLTISANTSNTTPAPTSASEFFDRAFKKFEEGDFVGAIEDYSQVIKLDPHDHVAWYNRGLARWNLRQNDEAIADYTEAVRLKPDYARAFYNRAIVRGAKGDFQGEIDDYTEAIRLDPKYHQAYNNRAATFIDTKQFDLAIMDANQAIWLKEDYTDAYYNRGLAKKNMGDVTGALADYNKALEINPDYNKAYRSRGIIYEERGDLLLAKADYEKYVALGGLEPDKIRGWIAEIEAKLAGGASGIGDPNQMTAAQLFKRAFEKHEQGDYHGSVADYSAVLEINPDDHIVWYNRGLGYYRIDENEKALADYTRCLELDANYINAYYNRGLVRKRLGNSVGAMEDYNETIRRDPNYVNVYRARGIIYEDNGEFDKAIADYQKYIELGGAEPDKIRGWIAEIQDKLARIARGQAPVVTSVGGMTAIEYFNRAYQKHDAGDFEGSVEDYSESLKLNPSDHLAWYNRGLGYYNLKKNAEAIADYSECIRIYPEYVNAYYNRGLARNRNGDKTGALLDYNETIRRKADYVNAYRARGIIYEEMGDYDRAIADYEKYIELGGTEPDKIRGWINEVVAKRESAGGAVFGDLTAEQYFDRAYQKHENGDYSGAIADYTEAIRLKPHDHLAWYNRGLGHYFLNQHSQAILDYTEAIRLNPEYVNAYYNRGLARNRNGDKSGAMDDYNETLRRKADYTNAYRARGILFEDLGDTTRAVADYQKYIELGGNEAEKVQGWIDAIKQKIASGNQNPPPRPKPTTTPPPTTDPFENIHLHDGMFRSADDPPEESSGYVGADGKIRWTKLDSGNGGVMTARQYFDRAFKKHDAGDFAGSVADYSEALKLNSRDHLAWYNRGLGYYNLGKHSQAISDYTECIRLYPEYINAYYNRGLARSKNGDAAGALADYNETLRRNPNYVNAYRARGIIYEDNGDFAKAIADYTRYIELGGTEPDKIKGWIREVEEKMRKK